jgi:hypothetical protein
MSFVIFLPFLFQAIVIGIDEIYFHVRRGLPKWERIGHPLDTFSVLVCMLYTLAVPFSKTSLIVYIVLAAFSCVMVTKDEFVHKEHCPAAEHWLHALLFLLHPITLTMTAIIWPLSQGVEISSWLQSIPFSKETLRLFLTMQSCGMGAFMFYQIVFWNFIREHTHD